MPKTCHGFLLARSIGTEVHQTYHRGSKLGGAGMTSILGSKTIREAAGGSRVTGVSVWWVSNGDAITMGLLLTGEGEGNTSVLSPRHL
jgi:hypothetical protein